jgi:hypothetical protein
LGQTFENTVCPKLGVDGPAAVSTPHQISKIYLKWKRKIHVGHVRNRELYITVRRNLSLDFLKKFLLQCKILYDYDVTRSLW